MITFNIVFERLLGHEGKYVNNPYDPGGETKWGISKRSYPHLDIFNLTVEQAKDIYFRDFWQRINADKLYNGVAFQVMDFAINSGIGTAVRKLQLALGVADDGYWGPVTQLAAQRVSETDQIMRFNAYRLLFMSSLSTWPNFGKGWARRVANNLLYGAEDS